MTDMQTWIRLAEEAGFSAAAIVETENIPFDFSFRPYCEENLCGQYGVNHSCPPECGSCEQMRQRILDKKHALVLQTIWQISDYSDLPAIKEAKRSHNQASLALLARLRQEGVDCFMVGSSGCALCSPCTAKEGLPCRLPELKYSCMSAYCIFVKQLCDRCGMEYDCGDGLLAFFGMLVF